jgi:FkbM family methyltransferase
VKSQGYLAWWCRRFARKVNYLFRPPAPDRLRQIRTHAIEAKPEQLLQLLNTIEDLNGHRISGQTGTPIRSDGRPLPWLTYPAIDYLEQLDLKNRRVFEYGSGYGPRYFAERCSEVVSVESDPQWYRINSALKPANLAIWLGQTEAEYVEAIKRAGGTFDLIVVDGLWRYHCVSVAVSRLAPGGVVILDNSDWFPHTAAYLRESGLLQVDFSGFGPVNYYPWTTSFFFRRDALLTPAGSVQPVATPGSHPLVADATLPEPKEAVNTDEVQEESSRSVSATSSAVRVRPGMWSYAQEGEDIILLRFLSGRTKGFYVDIGAHHPITFSNTYAFYCLGWRGINVDAQPGSMREFSRHRPEDINLELAVGNTRTGLTYFQFAEAALNTFSRERAAACEKHGYPIIGMVQLETVTLAEILDKYLPAGREIDFLTIDVEGLDLEVVQSNNWDKYRPRIVLVEEHGLRDLDNAGQSEIIDYLKSQGYSLKAKTFNTLFFARS